MLKIAFLSTVAAACLVIGLGSPCPAADAPATQPVGIVSHVKVLSDKVEDVSSLEAWKKTFIKDGMSDQEKAVAVWKSNVMFVYQDSPPIETLSRDGCVHDPIKSFNVYGYGMCCCASSRVEGMSRYLGMPARGLGIIGHSVPEVFWNDSWHLMDASLVAYYPKADGSIASVQDCVDAVKAFLEKNPEFRAKDATDKGANARLEAQRKKDNATGWKMGPDLLVRSPFFNERGWYPAKTHGWVNAIGKFDCKPFIYEYGYSLGYEVNVQLRPGERLTRNWSNSGVTINKAAGRGDNPSCIKTDDKDVKEFMGFLADYNDPTRNRVGSGTLEYDVPLNDPALKYSVLKMENLACKSYDHSDGPTLYHKLPDTRWLLTMGELDIDMPSSYVYLGGKVTFDAVVVGESAVFKVQFSGNNGLDWKEIATITKSGKQELDLTKFIVGRYDYRIRFMMGGKGTGLDSLRFTHDIQCSQRALPRLGKGENTITFSAGPQTGTLTIEGVTGGRGGQVLTAMDYHPTLANVDAGNFHAKGENASVTYPISAPGDITALRFGGHFRCEGKDKWNLQVSFDGGKTFKTIDTVSGPSRGECKYVAVTDVPSGVKEAQVRFAGEGNNAYIMALRIDADYKQPAGGLAPVQVKYVWQEDGKDKQAVHIAKSPQETWKITCDAEPVMKSVAVELAK